VPPDIVQVDKHHHDRGDATKQIERLVSVTPEDGQDSFFDRLERESSIQLCEVYFVKCITP
jgi:hypothetical protein